MIEAFCFLFINLLVYKFKTFYVLIQSWEPFRWFPFLFCNVPFHGFLFKTCRFLGFLIKLSMFNQKRRNHFGGSLLLFCNVPFHGFLFKTCRFLGFLIKLSMFNQKRRNRFGGFPLLESPFRRQGKTSSQVFP